MSERAQHTTHESAASFSPRVGRSPAFLTRYSSALFLMLLIGLEAGVVRFVIRDVRSANNEVQGMYVSSVLGLRRIGNLQYDAQETRRSTLYALTTNDSNLQVLYADQSREADARVTAGIAEYLQQAQLPQEVELGNRLQQDWKAYLAARNEVLGSILEGSIKDAVAYDMAHGVPLFEGVRRDLEETQRLYDDQASHRLANVAALATRTVTRLVTVLVVTVLIAGIFVWVLQKDKMASTMRMARMQMDFAASVSHELRTPLASILGAATVLSKSAVIAKDERLTSLAGVVRDEADRLNNDIQNLLDATRISRAQIRPRQEWIEPQDIVNSALERRRRRLSAHALSLDVDSNLPFIYVDPVLVEQAFGQIVDNAAKYSPPGSPITVAAKRNGRDVVLSVHDEGVGLTAQENAQLGERFFRGARHAATTSGSGLGLWIAKAFVTANGGKIEAASAGADQGTTVSIHLPFATPASQPEVGPDD